MDYARALVEHPKWRWEPGMGASWWQDAMVGWLPVVVADADGPIVRISYEDKSFMLSARLSDLLPALERPATKGWILHMLLGVVEAVHFETAPHGGTEVYVKWSLNGETKRKWFSGDEALAAALLAVWGPA